MTTECSICAEPYKDASSIPCGHIFCLACLQAHIAHTSQDELNATCPRCRTEFAFVTPDLSLIMKPLHKHIHPSIRKLYIDVNTQELDDLKVAYKKQVDLVHHAETQLDDMRKELNKMETELKSARDKLEKAEKTRTSEETGRLGESSNPSLRPGTQKRARFPERGRTVRRRLPPLDRTLRPRSGSFSWLLKPDA